MTEQAASCSDIFDSELAFTMFYKNWINKMTVKGKKMEGFIVFTEQELDAAMQQAWQDGAIACADFITQLDIKENV